MVNEGRLLNLSSLLALLKEIPAFRQLVGELSTAKGEHKAVILDAAKPYFIAALYEELNLPLVVVTAQPEGARRLHEQLQAWCSPLEELHWLPELDFLPYDSYRLPAISYQMLVRLRALATLAFYEDGDSPPLMVTSALAVMSKTIPQGDFVAACHVLKTGMTANPLELVGKWQGMGYEMEEVVEVPGQIGRRGGIIDVFPTCGESPVRIEFFGNRIESMRCFDPESQRSNNPLSSLVVTPANESMAIAESSGTLAGSVFDYLGDRVLLVLDDPRGIELAVTRLNEEAQELRAVKMERGELPQGFPSPYLTWEELKSQMEARHRLALKTWDANLSYGQALPFIGVQGYGGQLQRFLKEARKLVEQRQRVFIVSHQANRLGDLLQEDDIHTSPASRIERIPPPGSVTVLQGSLDGGWAMGDGLTIITDAELFGFVKQPRPSKRRLIPRRLFLPQLASGDYVVHVDHGIAKFNGLTRISSDGIEREYLVLEYAAGDKLYVPTERIDRVSRYIGAGDQAPSLSRLRTPEWERTKKRVKESVAAIAQELLELYAARELAPGFAFSADSLWQQELEASFPYIETPDQIETIMTVKEDMEKAKPMDRLICGDVGYGKTEIALRAAFKTIMDGKQVAILVPTTVLAQQHFVTFNERLQTFPLRVEMLSRFCPVEKEKGILQDLASGNVDICIGTHRLLQKDVTFKDLGLVIIDEEQQFGVVQKEKLKQLRKEVDTLALSATPIPRTLHMSLTGIRDMSIVETPPEERLSIKTYVGAYDGTLVRQAVLRELERDGQVFFVHNRVQSIAPAASKLQGLVPEARIAIAHGQMPEEQLEKVMTEFIAGKYDILVTTTIIQLGLDMPNVNTLIIDHADRFGLAQLYQLRGRVGRGVNQAYAYFFFDEGKRLTHQAYKRLRTIFEATELGSGLGIAMKDLEIRGAGSLLGVKQSGHIAALGFDLYCQLLAEAVEELKAKQAGEVRKKEIAFTPSMSLPLTAYIPEEYVPDLNTRLSLYHKLSKAEHIEEVEEITRELKDRFGTLPQPVENLLYVVKIKSLAMKAKVSSISVQGKQIVIKPLETVIASEAKQSLSRSYDGAVKVGITQIKLDTRLLGDRWMEVLEDMLSSNHA